MADISVYLVVTLMLVAGGISIIALVLWARMSPDPDQSIHRMISRAGGETVFLFDGLDLIDCTPPARRIMDELAHGGSDLHRLFRALSSRFGGLPAADKIADTRFEGEYAPRDALDGLRLFFESWDGFLRATIRHKDDEGAAPFVATQVDQGEEVITLRAVSDEAPFLMWRTLRDGSIGWANEAYLRKLKPAQPADEAPEWPPCNLFPGLDPEAATQRLPMSGEAEHFDIQSVEHGDGWLHFAISAAEAMKAENARQEFVQTITNTFGHLSIGLAIFDRERRLALFNPALTDLMPVPFDFLSSKPTLRGFLDRLHDEQLIAEPRNYKAWRKHIVELEAQAESGSYCETWSLPGGLTFRVTGRPHPGGAIAFLFEDVSAEMSLTRRFRSEIELGHAALDAMDEAVVLVSATGVISLTNRAYRKMWGDEPDESLVPTRFRTVLKGWRDETAENAQHWDTLISHVESREGPKTWYGATAMNDGRTLNCRVERLAGAAALIGFKISQPVAFPSQFKSRRLQPALPRDEAEKRAS